MKQCGLKFMYASCILVFSLVMSGCPKPDIVVPFEPTTGTEVLAKLGVTEVTTPPPLTTVSTIGTVVTPSAEWHPLRKEYSIFTPKAEVFMVGLQEGSTTNTLYEDGLAATAYAPTHPITGDQAWLNSQAKASCSADLDGDGIQEIVVFSVPTAAGATLNVNVYHNGAFSARTKVDAVSLPPVDLLQFGNTTFVTASLPGPGYSRYLGSPFAVRSADLDGNAIQELILYAFKTVYLLKVSVDGAASTLLESKTFAEEVSDVAAGDCDGDGKDEFVVTLGTLGFGVYDSSFANPLTNPAISTLPGSTQKQGEACFGDFDGDNLDEICIVSCENAQNVAYMYNVVDGSLEYKNKFSNGSRPANQEIYRTFPRAVDINGDGKDALFFTNWIIEDPMLTTSGSSYEMHDTNNYFRSIKAIEVADVDGDGKQDVVYYGLTALIKRQCVFAYGLNSNGAMTEKKRYVEFADSSIPDDYITTTVVNLVVGNVDDDSDRVKFNEHKLEFTSPIVMAVLASPPYWADVAVAEPTYSYTNWATSYGTSSSTGSGKTSTVGMSMGVTVEFEQEISFFGIKGAQFKASAAFKSSLDWSWAASSEVSFSKSFSCVGGEDRVIFTAVPIDTYYYTVVQSSKVEDIGKLMTISLPRKFNIYSVDRAFYNENNGPVADIGSDVLKHTLGEPKTYHSAAEKNALLAAHPGYESSTVSVAQYSPPNTSGGYTEFGIDASTVSEKSIAVDSSMDFEVGGGAGGVSVVGTFGFHAGAEYTTSTSTGTSFSGTVGNLPTKYFSNPNYGYSQGLFVYPYTTTGKNVFWVVDYWTEY